MVGSRRGRRARGTSGCAELRYRKCRRESVLPVAHHFAEASGFHRDQRMLGVLRHFARIRVQFANQLDNRAVHSPESGSAAPTTTTR